MPRQLLGAEEPMEGIGGLCVGWTLEMLPLHLWLPGLLNRVVPLSTVVPLSVTLGVTEQLHVRKAPKELAKSMDLTVRLAWFLPHLLMLWDLEGPHSYKTQSSQL